MKFKFRFLLLSIFLFTACNFNTLLQPTWDDPVKNFFDEYTNTASIGEYIINPNDSLIDKYGNICIPWTEDHEITFFLRNPQHFSFIKDTNMTLKLAGDLDGNQFSDRDIITLIQNSDDPTLITLTYPTEFLQAHPTGANISPLINLYHPVSQADFGTYDGLILSSNSPPPTPSGAVVVQTNENPSKWVVCFNLPDANTINKYHNDIESLTFNNSIYSVSISNGNISYNSDIITTTAPANLVANAKTGVSFTSDGQSTYIFTGDIADENNKIYTLTFVDNAGLSTNIYVSAQGFKLTSPNAYLTSDTGFNSPFAAGTSFRNVIRQDDEGNAQITIHAQANTLQTDSSAESQTYDPSDAKIIYEIYSDEACTNLIKSGSISGLTGTINLPNGNSYIKALVRKPLYVDSDPVIWYCHSIFSNLYVSSNGNDTENTGSKQKPFATIQKAINVIENGITNGDYTSSDTLEIILLSDITADSGFDFSSNNDSFVNFSNTFNSNTIEIKSDGDTERTISAGQNQNDPSPRQKRVMTVNAGNIKLSNINLSSGYCQTNSNSGNGGGLAVLGGSVTYTKGTVSGNTAYQGGGIYIGSGSVTQSPNLTLDQVTVSDNIAASAGGGIYSEGTLTLAGKDITVTSNTLSSGSAGNLYLTVGKIITVTADISGSSISVNKAFAEGGEPRGGSPVLLTQGYGTYNSSGPATIFTSENNYAIGGVNGEAAFAVSGGTLYNPANYSFTTSLTPATNGSYYFYPGHAKTFTLTLNPTYINSGTSPTPLYYNYANQELYSDPALTQAVASGFKVTWNATLYCGTTIAHSFTPENVSGGISLTIPTTIAYEDTYVLKVTYTYIGLSYNANYTIYGANNVSSVSYEITNLTQDASFSIIGAITTSNLSSLRSALLALSNGNSTAKVKLDLSETSGLTDISGSYSFSSCSALQEIVLPTTLTSLGAQAFYNCTSLSTIKFAGTTAQWNAITLGTDWHAGAPATQVICSNGNVSIE